MEGNHAVPHRRTKAEEMKHRLEMRKHQLEMRKHQLEVQKYKAWLRSNITKSKISGNCRTIPSKLSAAEKEGLFQEHVNELCQESLRDYKQSLNYYITTATPPQSIYLKSWSSFDHIVGGRKNFRLLTEAERQREWCMHANQIKILKKSPKTK